MTAGKHIAVVGAGIVGVATAIWLQRAGHTVTLIDRLPPGEGTSHGNGGVLASAAVVPVTTPGILRKAPGMLLDRNQPLYLRWPYLPRLAPWLIKYLRHANAHDTERIVKALVPIVGDSLADHQALSAGTQAARFVIPTDYLYLYKDKAAFQSDAFGWKLRTQAGFDWHEMGSEAVQRYDPIFSEEIGHAACLTGHGRISDPGSYVKTLAAHAEGQGARLIRGELTDFQRDNGRLTGLRVGGEAVDCDAAVLALGAWSKPLAAKLGINVPLESERGYHIELINPSVMPKAPVMVAAGKFVATPMEGRLRLAGIVEFGGLHAGPSKAPFDLLRRLIGKVIPQLSWEREVEWMGHRPAPADSIPVIGEAPGLKGVWMGFGHHHVGLTGGPKTGRLLAQMITGATPNIDVSPYSPSRFT